MAKVVDSQLGTYNGEVSVLYTLRTMDDGTKEIQLQFHQQWGREGYDIDLLKDIGDTDPADAIGRFLKSRNQ